MNLTTVTNKLIVVGLSFIIFVCVLIFSQFIENTVLKDVGLIIGGVIWVIASFIAFVVT